MASASAGQVSAASGLPHANGTCRGEPQWNHERHAGGGQCDLMCRQGNGGEARRQGRCRGEDADLDDELGRGGETQGGQLP